MSTTTTVDPAKIEAFAEKVMSDFAGGSACYLGALGDARSVQGACPERAGHIR